jgi:hypoxanthine-DNA glycosylase
MRRLLSDAVVGAIVTAFSTKRDPQWPIAMKNETDVVRASADASLLGLAPIGDPEARLLILGSFPGEASLVAARYYGHPRNQFWTLLGAVVGESLDAVDPALRAARLVAHRVAVWDVIARCERSGSLDSAIRSEVANDIGGLLARWTKIATIAFNGGKAASYRKRIAAIPEAARCRLVTLPSSSPANATHSLAVKRAAWLAALAPALADGKLP